MNWTAHEDTLLARHCGEMAVDEIAAALNRSPRAVEGRMARLGLRSTQGRMSALAAARRIGVSQPTVVRALLATGGRRKPRANARKLAGRGAQWWSVGEKEIARLWDWIRAHCRLAA